MISVEQILLLQQKVESAVQKIEQLKSENDALRAERSELTKALSEKSELLSRFSADEKKIEDGILGALNRLDAVENALLDNSSGQKQASLSEEPTKEASAEPSAQETIVQQETTQASAPEPAPQTTVQNQETEATQIQETQDNDDLFGDDSFETQEENVPDIF